MSVPRPPKRQPTMDHKVQQQKGKQIWDCGSSLYDSFELKSFERQLDSAISSRTLSMPHLSDHRPRQPPPPPAPPMPKKASKFSRSFQKLLRSIFGPKQAPSRWYKAQKGSEDRFYVLYDRSGVLSTIPEVPETGGLSPGFKSSLVGRSASERFSTPASIGISCA